MKTSSKQDKKAGRRTRTGFVSSLSGDKTISVIVEKLVKHPAYGKYIRRRSRLAVHDPNSSAGVGDLVEVVPCRRISKSKSWRLVRVVRSSSTSPSRPGVEEAV